MQDNMVWKIKDTIFLRLLLGIPLILCGSFFAYIGNSGNDMLLFIIGSILTAAGIVSALLRSGTDINLKDGKVHQWKGLIVPMKDNLTDIHDYSAVFIDTRMESSKLGAMQHSPAYRVGLLPKIKGKNLVLIEHSNIAKSRIQSIQIAKFIRLPIIDASGPVEKNIAPDFYDKSLREKLKAGDNKPQQPTAPTDTNIEVSDEEGCRILKIKKPSRKQFYIGVFSLCFLAIYCYYGVLPYTLHIVNPLTRLAITLVLFLLFFILLLIRMGTEISIRIYPTVIEIQKKYFTVKRRNTIKIDEIVDIDMHLKMRNKYTDANSYNLSFLTAMANVNSAFEISEGDSKYLYLLVLNAIVRS